MPDENGVQAGTAQTSQNDQTTTNPSGDDFVLDFGDKGAEGQGKNAEVEIDNLEGEENKAENGIDENFNDNISDEAQDKDAQEQNNKIEDDSIENEGGSNDFDISLEENKEEGNMEEVEYDEEGIKDENVEGEGGSNDFDISLEENKEEGGEAGYNNEEFTSLTNEDLDLEAKESDSNETFLSSNDENLGEFSKNTEINANSNEGEDTIDNDDNLYVDSEKFNNSSIVDESTSNESLANIGESEDETTKVDASDYSEASTNNNPNFTENNTQDLLSQPEIGDLLGDPSTNSSVEESEDAAVEEENDKSMELNKEPDDVQENAAFTPENKEDYINEGDQSSVYNNTENQSFTLDYSNSQENKVENGGGEVFNENTELPNSIQSNTAPEENNMVNYANQIENTDSVESQQISTLSLDQILDTELSDNSQFTDSSKAVPINVSTNKGLFSNKKMVGVIAGMGLFLLAGAAVVTLPLGSSSKNPGSPMDTDQIVEEFVDDHQAANPVEDLEADSDGDEGSEEDIQGDTSIHEDKVTVQQDFPDVERDDGSEFDEESGNEGGGEIEPYVCDEDGCSDESVYTQQVKEVEVKEILLAISDYKSQAEVYYSQGDEMQDKKLIKYALKIVSLCDDYQEQIQNGESLDEESFSSFKSKINKLLTKMEEYLGGESYTESYHNDEYDELRNYLYERENW